jgi:coproporphyrinogen III oxidase-like Fe-S oxidoreductase
MPTEQTPCTTRTDLLAEPPAPTAFGGVVLPWYTDQKHSSHQNDREQSGGPGSINAVPHGRAAAVGSSRLGINIQCPPDTVDGYVGLVCREAELARALLPAPCAVTSLWLRGNPSRQFSPEAVTELIFRLNNQFPLTTQGAVRGVELSVPALSAERLALLAGLGFNRIGLRVDATLGSDERSLERLDTMQRQLADFPSLAVSYEVAFGSQSHPAYLARLLAAMRNFPAASIELKDARTGMPQALEDRRETASLLRIAVTEMTAAGWRTFGNHLHVPPASPLAQAREAEPLRLTPWGPQPAAQHLWLGLGIGAFGYRHPAYYRNTPSTADYLAALRRRQLPDKVIYRVPAKLIRDLDVAQSLLCHHRVARDVAPEFCEQLRHDGLLEMTAHNYQLTPTGVFQLGAILHRLHQQAVSGDDHGTTQTLTRHDG